MTTPNTVVTYDEPEVIDNDWVPDENTSKGDKHRDIQNDTVQDGEGAGLLGRS